MSINDRIKYLIEYFENGNQSKFCARSTIKKTTLSGIVGTRQSDPSSKILNCVIDGYNEINPTWLLTGKGEMLLSESEISTNKEVVKLENTECLLCAEKDKRIEELKDTILILKEKCNGNQQTKRHSA